MGKLSEPIGFGVSSFKELIIIPDKMITGSSIYLTYTGTVYGYPPNLLFKTKNPITNMETI
jgi:hypothetical protein